MKKSIASLAACLGLFAVLAIGSMAGAPPAAASIGGYDLAAPVEYIDDLQNGLAHEMEQIHGQGVALAPLPDKHNPDLVQVSVDMAVPAIAAGISVLKDDRSAAREVGQRRNLPAGGSRDSSVPLTIVRPGLG